MKSDKDKLYITVIYFEEIYNFWLTTFSFEIICIYQILFEVKFIFLKFSKRFRMKK
jgi:hypothetical protein